MRVSRLLGLRKDRLSSFFRIFIRLSVVISGLCIVIYFSPLKPRIQVRYYEIQGQVAYKMGNLGLAEEQYKKALEIEPQSKTSLLGLGQIARHRRQYELAIERYQRASLVEPNNGYTRAKLGVILMIKGHYRMATREFMKAYDLLPEDPVINANLAVGYHYLGKFELRDLHYSRAKEFGYRQLNELDSTFRE
ncbi:tetratricopeptide repeat protein [Pelagicoccus albus]|uniref:Tetratricopeptide repeat protein n=1 Tax=Pelagicoccus albus TaxID=415222 RepID=A0A7X1BB15_9BACT|nr:tetratricopeptide repeat protein [Pelagicoccus albus]MBC2607738.1 tetratricopeptide repeat protein [Pelagicoccus albus]